MDLVEVNDQGVATRRRVSKAVIEKVPAKEILTNALVDARVLVTGQETASTCEVAHEAIFTGWQRLAKWIEVNGDAMRVCRNLKMAARDWRDKGAPRFSYLPDRAALRQYRGVAARCRHEEGDASAVQGYLTAARRRRRIWGGLLAIAILIGSLVGVDSWRAYKGMSWNAVGLWGLLRVGVYKGPPMVPVPAGRFEMGCVGENPECRPFEKRVQGQRVCLEAFEMGVFEVTQDQWAAVMGDNPSFFKEGGGQLPVERVSWGDASEFIRRLNALTGRRYRLPTEAEWEYAARSGGREETYAGGENLNDLGWYRENSEGKTHPVKQGDPNGLRLYDMSGNVWEWVADDWHDNYQGAPTDGSPWVDDPRAANRVTRGGSWLVGASDCRSASRFFIAPLNRHDAGGFRLARSVALGP